MVPLVEVALDVRWEDTVQCYYLVAERAGGVGDGVGLPLKRSRMRIGWDCENRVGGCQPRRVRGRAHRAWRYGR